MKKKTYTVRIGADGENQVEARIGMRVRWLGSPQHSIRGEIVDIHGYDHDDTAQYREVLHVRCDDGQTRRPICNNVPVYLDATD